MAEVKSQIKLSEGFLHAEIDTIAMKNETMKAPVLECINLSMSMEKRLDTLNEQLKELRHANNNVNDNLAEEVSTLNDKLEKRI